MKKITFITGNENKLKEARAILKDFVIENKKLDLPEIQEIDAGKIIEAKLRQAYESEKATYIVEDTSLYIEALNGLPGPLIKWFLETIGTVGIYELASKYDNQVAYTSCMIGYIDEKGRTDFFEGRVKGKIVEPRGKTNFGWDPIFLPDGHEKTFAEMTEEEKNATSHRKLAFVALGDFLKNLRP
ncbi:RdgB/HAM1 family non-canonical purine NTP pyrophosphatase [Candidatus Kaiserbacteria bacterium]|nr:RdgB/HAM1 family non-canonical purine NTP pyrophosphatase [Candidatus Kaiserbacteria bacterium]USN92489.1 MAG: RdgB/HAM1 family non-canonical purine NTP pyrophosphatase [Candidatus Nomurabacteria bacterium]